MHIETHRRYAMLTSWAGRQQSIAMFNHSKEVSHENPRQKHAITRTTEPKINSYFHIFSHRSKRTNSPYSMDMFHNLERGNKMQKKEQLLFVSLNPIWVRCFALFSVRIRLVRSKYFVKHESTPCSWTRNEAVKKCNRI